jgi:hypothetical protein
VVQFAYQELHSSSFPLQQFETQNFLSTHDRAQNLKGGAMIGFPEDNWAEDNGAHQYTKACPYQGPALYGGVPEKQGSRQLV